MIDSWSSEVFPYCVVCVLNVLPKCALCEWIEIQKQTALKASLCSSHRRFCAVYDVITEEYFL